MSEKLSEPENIKDKEIIVINYPHPGKYYDHYKGGRYLVLFLTRHTETNEVLVIYESVHFKSIHAKPLDKWNERYDDPDAMAMFKNKPKYSLSNIQSK